MTTEQSPLSRQPTKLDYASPTQFKFGIVQLPKVEFFTTSATLPGINMGSAVFPTPYKDIPVMGDKLTYDNLSVSFLVDEHLENYISLHEWMTAIGFPENRSQFSTFRSSTSNTPTETRAKSDQQPTIGLVEASTPDRSMYGDATLTILTNKNNPIVEVRFRDVYPVSLSALQYDQSPTDVQYLTADVDFDYTIYEIVTL
tara:strand:+ start:48 stop:647 length:600 start_codon:yes stop_codon:yes gene_type:complete